MGIQTKLRTTRIVLNGYNSQGYVPLAEFISEMRSFRLISSRRGRELNESMRQNEE